MVETTNIGGVTSRDAKIGLYAFWGAMLYYYDASGNIEYICCHEKNSWPTSSDGWAIFKFTTGASGVETRQVLTGICDNRATLDWR